MPRGGERVDSDFGVRYPFSQWEKGEPAHRTPDLFRGKVLPRGMRVACQASRHRTLTLRAKDEC